ncbi:low-complexity protein [filamentous cyanobacterium CCP5]|nr:low-complexity protein [filamentous cyanobacterium CCP5]
MRRRYLALLPWLSALLLATPVLAEEPFVDVREFNIRRLLITNACFSCNLAGVDLSGIHLIGADLRKADLTAANLSGVNLEGADLTGADLTAANLSGAFLTNASLAGADLDYANFAEAQLYFVDVTGASMEGLNLAGATVIGTPISVGGGDEEYEDLSPTISPEEIWQIHPPSAPLFPSNELIDVPEQVLPLS